jgi:squalene synthase HpnC
MGVKATSDGKGAENTPQRRDNPLFSAAGSFGDNRFSPTPIDMAVHSCETDHYENFPVASILCPARLRPAIGAIYAFSRTADDLADEGEATPEQRLADLRAYREDLLATTRGEPVGGRWPQVFARLRPALREFELPLAPLLDLLSAFEQDVVKQHYVDSNELLDYCRRSANPVGRLLLHLYGVTDARSLAQSDAICTALQLANFWQDLSVDVSRQRLYVPLRECEQSGVDPQSLASGTDSPAVRELVRTLVRWTRVVMQAGAELPHTLQAQAGWRVGMELRLVVQGGLRILDKIEANGFDSLQRRPRLGALDGACMVWRALRMRAPVLATVTGAA